MRKSLPVMNAPSGPMSSAATVATSSGFRRDRRDSLEHPPIALTAGSGEFVHGERSDDDAGADRVDAGAALGPPNCLGHDPQRVPALRELVGVERVGDLIWLEHGERQQVLGRGGCEGRVLLGVRAPRRCPDCDAITTPAPPGAITLPNSSSTSCGAIQVDREDGFGWRLTGRDAGGVDEPGDVAVRRRGLDERVNRVARGHVDGGGADVEAGVAHHLGRPIRVLLVQVRQHDVLTGANAPGYGLADRSGPMTMTTSVMA